MSKMLRFIWNKQHNVSADRVDHQKQLFKYSECVVCNTRPRCKKAVSVPAAAMRKLLYATTGQRLGVIREHPEFRERYICQSTLQHGFPSKPSALGYDPSLSLIAIGTKTGRINVYGRPGVEFYGQHSNTESAVRQIIFIPNQGRLITHCDDNSLHLWQTEFSNTGAASALREVKTLTLEGKLKTISTCCLEDAGGNLLVGTEGGNIYLLNVTAFQLTDNIIYQDVVMQNVPDDYKVNPGAVECIRTHPCHADKVLIGYNRGLMVVFDRKLLNAERVGIWDRKVLRGDQTYVCNQSLETVCWSRDGSEFMSAHNDGSFIVWNARKLSKPDGPHTPYGPFPCKSMTRLRWCTAKDDGDWVVFCGGMPRASYGDKHTVSVIRRDDKGEEQKHVAFDFTSAVVDFVLLHDYPTDPELGWSPHSLLVLTDEEMVCVDLVADSWPVYNNMPYLNSIHSSAVTNTHYVTDCNVTLYQQLLALNSTEAQKPWPITGGVVLAAASTAAGDKDPSSKASATESSDGDPKSDLSSAGQQLQSRDLLLTGHEDGTVRVWAAGGAAFRLICKLSTARLFSDSEDAEESRATAEDDDDEFPPLRSVGVFDPYSDDPRLAVKRLAFCPHSGLLLTAGTAGQITLWRIAGKADTPKLQPVVVDLVADQDSFVWKGHEKLPLRREPLQSAGGYQPFSVVQLHPPAVISAVNLQSSWGMFAAGTGHGFLLFDFTQNKSVMHKCTLSPNDYAAAGESPMTRGKSLKKSLRESFRRLRKGRSQRGGTAPGAGGKGSGAGTVSTTVSPSSGGPANNTNTRGGRGLNTGAHHDVTLYPVERAIEARCEDPAYAGMVRSLYLATSYLANGQPAMRTMWAGTNSGAIFVYAINCASGDKRNTESVTWQPGKEFRLKHGAPVLDIQIVDSDGCPLITSTHPADSDKPSQHPAPHRVIITSEEQFKVFTLPTMRPFGKFKLTALEGSRVRRIGYGRFSSNETAGADIYSEWCLMCLTNQGDLNVFSLPELRRHLQKNCLRREDIQGITSLVYSGRGEALYMASSSLYQRLSLSAGLKQLPSCKLQLPAGSADSAESCDKRRTTSGQSCTSSVGGRADLHSFDSGADTTLDSHRDFFNADASSSSQQQQKGTSSSSPEPEVVEISTEEANRLLDGMKGLVNGVGGTDEKSFENYTEEKNGVKKSLEKSRESHITATEQDSNTLTAQRQETERVLSTEEATEDAVTTRSRQEMKVVRTTRITATTTHGSAEDTDTAR